MRLRLRKYRILEIMDEKGINSLKVLGEHLSIDPANLSSLLGNKTTFTRETLEKLLGALDCELEDVLEVQVDKKEEGQ